MWHWGVCCHPHDTMENEAHDVLQPYPRPSCFDLLPSSWHDGKCSPQCCAAIASNMNDGHPRCRLWICNKNYLWHNRNKACTVLPCTRALSCCHPYSDTTGNEARDVLQVRPWLEAWSSESALMLIFLCDEDGLQSPNFLTSSSPTTVPRPTHWPYALHHSTCCDPRIAYISLSVSSGCCAKQ